MEIKDIYWNVKKALATSLNLSSPDQIEEAAHLKDDLGLDSMSSLTFLMALEDNIHGFVVDAETLTSDDLLSVDTVSQYIKNQLASVK